MQLRFQRVNGIEGEVVKELLAQLVPERFDRIEFRGIGRQR